MGTKRQLRTIAANKDENAAEWLSRVSGKK